MRVPATYDRGDKSIHRFSRQRSESGHFFYEFPSNAGVTPYQGVDPNEYCAADPRLRHAGGRHGVQKRKGGEYICGRREDTGVLVLQQRASQGQGVGRASIGWKGQGYESETGRRGDRNRAHRYRRSRC